MSKLPEGWERASIGDLIATDGLFVDGDWVESKDQDPAGEVRLTQLADIGDGRWRDRSDRYLTAAAAAQLRCTDLQRDDVLVARMPDPLGRACLFPGDPKRCVTVVDVAIIRPGRRSADPRWLMYAINAPQARTAIESMQSGTTRKRISRKNLGTVELPVAPLAEQSRIVAAIEEAFSKLDAGEAGLLFVRQLLRRMRDAVLAAAVTGRLVAQDPTDAPAAKVLADLGVESVDASDDLPAPADGWVWSTLGAICESIRNGIFVSRPPDVPPGVPILRIGAVRRLELDLGDVRYAPVDLDDRSVQRALLATGDLLFTRYNGNPEFVGACAVVPEVTGPLLHPDKLIRAVVDRRAVDPTYVAIAASAGASRSFIDRVTKTTAGQAGIAGGDLKLVPVPVPPMAEQARIVAEVERQLSFIEACERSVTTGLGVSAALRRSVLRCAFEGRLVPQDPNDEPASVLLERIKSDRAAAPKPHKRRTRATA